MVGQTLAVINVLSRLSPSVDDDWSLEGTAGQGYVTSQMLLGCAEELHGLLTKHCFVTREMTRGDTQGPTGRATDGAMDGATDGTTDGAEVVSFDHFFGTLFPAHLTRLEALLTPASVPGDDSTGACEVAAAWQFPHRRPGPAALNPHRPSCGELHLFGVLHQALLIRTPPLMRSGGGAPTLRAW
jgi:hypothetical protein